MRPENAVRFDRTLGRWFYPLHKRVYGLTKGRVGSRLLGRPALVLTATGRKSGEQREVPLQYMPRGEEMVVVGSNGGRDQHPAWYLNVSANPDVRVRVGRREVAARARVVTGGEKQALWKELGEFYPGYPHYQTLTSREIPVVVLTPTS